MKRAVMAEIGGRYKRLFEELLTETQGREPLWLREQRERAFERFVASGLPTRRVEAWKYTDVSTLAVQDYVHGSREAEVDADVLALPIRSAEDVNVVFVDGLLRPELCTHLESDGLKVSSLADAAETPELRGALTRTNVAMESAFVCLNRALWRDGVIVRVSGKRKLERRVHVSFVLSSGAGERITSPRLVFAMGDLAEAKLMVSHVGGGKQKAFSNGVVDIDVGDGAQLELCRIQASGPRCTQIETTRVSQGRDSTVRCSELVLGGALARHDLSASLLGEGGSVILDGAYAVRDRQVADFHTTIEHCVPNCRSRQLYKGLLDDRGTGTFSGLVRVHPGASGTDGEQMNRNLLLSGNAKAHSKPELEILNDDVRCTHGATIGQLDEQELFYLASRGIGPEQARRMLCRGFVEEVLFRVQDEQMRAGMQAMVGRWSGDES